MTRRRWIADEVSGDRAALVGEHAEHLARVLRARVGQEFDISTSSGVRRGRISSISRDRVEFELGDELAETATAQITLALSIFKFDRMEWAIEKCTELGAARIVPVVARRSDAHLVTAADKRVERWRRIAKQAAEQSRRVSPPEIAQPLRFEDFVNFPAGTRIVLAESGSVVTLKEALASRATESSVVLAIGPEGGWTDSELQSFHEASWVSASLGSTILRAETAAIAALAVALSEIQR
jgi:16S rRNA (uracil1498-N3)-methyltransferase